MTGSHYGGNDAVEGSPLFSFSPTQGLTAIAAVNPFGLIHWPMEESHLPARYLAWLVLALTACACVLAGRGRTVPPPARSLAILAAASLIGWLAANYGTTFFAGGITKPTQQASLLHAYLFFLGRRVELWLLFLGALTAGVSVYLSRREGRAPCHRHSDDRRGRDHPGSVVASPRAHASGSTPELLHCLEPRRLWNDHA